jgi:uncharacterized protein
MADTSEERSGVKKRGFAAMNPELQREISRKGGSSVPDEKRSYSKDPAFARACGSMGGKKSGIVRKEKAATKGQSRPASVLSGLPVQRDF